MDILLLLAELVEAHFSSVGYSLMEVVQTFVCELKREVDFIIEGRSTEWFVTLFQDDLDVIFFGVYWDVMMSCVLAIDEIEGMLLANAMFV